ncbi:hypothetical protein BASA61_007469 [Batrachochytrium salamandrivorans]|nr:hypothetical protein BASA61_007469 [Batrachochytrium salamandrivorans]
MKMEQHERDGELQSYVANDNDPTLPQLCFCFFFFHELSIYLASIVAPLLQTLLLDAKPYSLHSGRSRRLSAQEYVVDPLRGTQQTAFLGSSAAVSAYSTTSLEDTSTGFL